MPRADYLRALAVVLIWGLNFVVMKWGLAGLSPMLLGTLRFCVAALPFVLFIPRPALPARYWLGYGLVQGLGQFGLLFWALSVGMTAGMASVVMQSQAFFTMALAAPLLGERARPQQWAGLVVATIGLLAIGLSHGEGPGQMTLIGFVLTLGAAFMWASSNLVVRLAVRHTPNYDPFAFIVWSSLAPILPFALLAVGFDGLGGEHGVLAQLGSLNNAGIGSVLYLALLATLAAYTLWTRLLKRHAAARVVPFSLLVPVVGLWAAAAAFGERPSPAQWAGTIAVLAGLLINQWGGRSLGRR
ncbi:EamA family transporter [Rivibacter subsaxonicus]|nr:EamA family transporter [Rivibacter subsaxonicus]